MTRRKKLLAAICNNPKAVRFEEACQAAEIIGFQKTGGKGSHCVYTKPAELEILNFQNRDGYIYPYQARQLIKLLEKYDEE